LQLANGLTFKARAGAMSVAEKRQFGLLGEKSRATPSFSKSTVTHSKIGGIKHGYFPAGNLH
jgi:hypothetical protein